MKHGSPARRVTQAGLLMALNTALLYMLYILPTMRLSVLFVLSVLPVSLAYERRFADGLLSFAGAAVLSGFLFPAPGSWVLYVAFFGWYGIVREWIVTRCQPIVAQILLFALFSLAAAAVWFIAREVLVGFAADLSISIYWLVPILVLVFAVYEFLFGRMRAWYLEHIHRHLFRT